MKPFFLKIIFLSILSLSFVPCYSNFIENKGQLKDTKGNNCNSIKAYTKKLPINVYIHENGNLSFVLNQYEQKTKNHDVFIAGQNKINLTQYRLDLKFISNLIPTIALGEKQDFYDHFYLDNEKYEYLYNYNFIILKGIYKNIDLKIKIDNNKIKYDFIVNPGGNPSEIKYLFEGSLATKLNEDGSIHIKTDLGDIFDSKPLSFQENVEIKSNYKLENNIISYQIDNYDKSKTLIIDPIIWSTYLGGGGYDESLAIDREAVNEGNGIRYYNYVCGNTLSNNFPYTIGTFISTPFERAFISKYEEFKGTLLYTIHYGQYNQSIIFSDLQVVGLTPTRSYYSFSHQPNKKIIVCGSRGSNSLYNLTEAGIISSFEASSGTLNYIQLKDGCYFTKLSKVSFGNNSYNKVYITGLVPNTSQNIFQTTTNAFQPNYGGGSSDALLVKARISDGGILYSSFLGGNNQDLGVAIDVYKNPASTFNEMVLVGGNTNSTTGIASPNAFDPTFNVGGHYDTFISNFNFSTNVSNVNNDVFNGRSWSTYFGGNQEQYVFDLEIDEEGANQSSNAFSQFHIVGRTGGDLPLFGQSFQNTFGGVTDGFIATFNLFFGSCIYSSYLGGDGSDQITAVRPYRYYGNFYIELVGATNSSDFPITSNAFKPNQTGYSDGFITVLKANNLNGPSVNQLFYSTYFGSDVDFDEIIFDVAKTSMNGAGTNDTTGTITFTGISGQGYPVQAGPGTTTISQPNCGGFLDAVITRFSYMDAARPANEDIKIQKDILSSEITIYPNPSKNNIFISEVSANDIIQIYDVSGRIIFDKQILTDEVNFQINLDNFQSGYYRILITNDFKTYSNAFIKE